MKLPELEITCANIWHSPENISESKPRFVTRYEVECFTSDGGVSVVDGERCAHTPGLILFARPGQIRFSRLPFSAKFIYFDVQNENGFGSVMERVPTFSAPTEKTGEIFEKIVRKSSSEPMLATTLLIELLLILAEDDAPTKKSSPGQYQAELYRAIGFMKQNLGRKLTVSEMASYAGYSAPHFTALFRELTGSTPYDYFMSLRISEAKRLLVSEGLSSSEIAESLGFSAPSHFCDVFRKFTGCTPREFLKSGSMGFYEGEF